MKISAKTIYGLQFLTCLAVEGSGKWMQIKEIVEKEKISEKYLESIVSRLKSGGLLQVKRGAQGGYKLAYSPSQISLQQIISVIEGTELSRDLESGSGEINTVVRQVSVSAIKKIDDQFNTLLKVTTLEDLANETSQQLNSFDFMI